MKKKKFVIGSVLTGIILTTALAFNVGIFPSILNKTDAHVNSTTKVKKTAKITIVTEEKNLIYSPPKQEEYHQDMTKEGILLKMINSIDNFKTAKGEFKVNYGQGEQDIVYEVSHQMKDARQYDFKVFEKDSDPSHFYNYNYKNDTFWTINKVEGTFNVTSSVQLEKREPLSLNTAFTVDNEGIDVTDYRERPLAPSARISLYPYEDASNYTRNLNNWNIEKQNEPLLGHNTVLIKGRHSASAFRFWVDKDTGILLKFETYSSVGKVETYLYPVSLDVNIPVNSNDFTPDLENLQKEEKKNPFSSNRTYISGGAPNEIPKDLRVQWETGLKKTDETTVFEKDGTWYIIPKVGYCVGSIEDGKIHLTKLSAQKSQHSIPSIAHNYGDKNLTVVYDN